jgi:hypothetical protein
MPQKTLYVHFTSLTGVECCLVASSISAAARALATYSATLKARSKIYKSPEQVPEHLHQAMAMANERPEKVIILENGSWKPLSGDPANKLLDSRQLALRGTSNAQIGASKMEIHSITCDADTWAKCLELGGSKWFRETVKTAHKRMRGKQSGSGE